MANVNAVGTLDINVDPALASLRKLVVGTKQSAQDLSNTDFTISGSSSQKNAFFKGFTQDFVDLGKAADAANKKVAEAARTVAAGAKLPGGVAPGVRSGATSVSQAYGDITKDLSAKVAEALNKRAADSGIAQDANFRKFADEIVQQVTGAVREVQTKSVADARLSGTGSGFGPTIGKIGGPLPDTDRLLAEAQKSYTAQNSALNSQTDAIRQETAERARNRTRRNTTRDQPTSQVTPETAPAQHTPAEEASFAAFQQKFMDDTATKVAEAMGVTPAAPKPAPKEFGSQDEIDRIFRQYGLEASEATTTLAKLVNQYRKGLLTEEELEADVAEQAVSQQQVTESSREIARRSDDLVQLLAGQASQAQEATSLRERINTALARYASATEASGREAIALPGSASRPIALPSGPVSEIAPGGDTQELTLDQEGRRLHERINVALAKYAERLEATSQSSGSFIRNPGGPNTPNVEQGGRGSGRPPVPPAPPASPDDFGRNEEPRLTRTIDPVQAAIQAEGTQESRAAAEMSKDIQSAGSQRLRAEREMADDIQSAGRLQIRAENEMLNDIQSSGRQRLRAEQEMLNDIQSSGRQRLRAETEMTKSLTTAAERRTFTDVSARRAITPENFRDAPRNSPGLSRPTTFDLTDPNNPVILQKTRRNQFQQLTAADDEYIAARRALDNTDDLKKARQAGQAQLQDLLTRRQVTPEKFVSLPGNIEADFTGPLVKFFDTAKNQAVLLTQADDRYVQAEDAFLRKATLNADTGLFQLNKQTSVNQQQRNAQSLRKNAVGESEFAPDVFRVNTNVVADTRDSVLRLYKSTADGYEELRKGTEPYLKAQQDIINQSVKESQGGVGNSFLRGVSQGGFGQGSGGSLVDNFAHSAGITLKYAVLGQTFYNIQNAIAGAGKQLLDFEDALTELNIATGQTNQSQEFLDQLGDIAAKAGVNIGDAMNVAADGIRAFKDQIGTTKTDVEEFGTSYTQVVAEVARITGTDLKTAETSVTAADLGFKIPGSSQRIADVITGSKQVGGGNEADVATGLGKVASAYNAIGFSAEETGVIISKLNAETGESGTDLATKLSRISSVISGSSGQKAIRDLNASLTAQQKKLTGAQGISLNESVADQIKDLGKVYNQLTDVQKKPLINALGGTASARELELLLGNITEIEQKANDPSNFDGKGAEEYAERLKNLRAQLAALKGDVANITEGIATSGIAQPLFDLVGALIPALNITKSLVQAFDDIPGPLRQGAGYILALLAGIKAVKAISAAGGVGGVLGKVEGVVSPQRGIARGQLSDEAEARRKVTLDAGGPEADAIRAADERAAASAARRAALVNGVRGDQLGNTISTGAKAAYDLGGKAVTSFGASAKTAGAELADAARRAAVALGLLTKEAEVEAERVIAVGAAGEANVVAGGAKAAQARTFAVDGAGVATEVGEAAELGLGARLLPTFAKAGSLIGDTLAGVLGPIGIAIGGVVAVKGTVDAVNRIKTAVDEFNQLSKAPDGVGATALANSAANLRSSANALRQSSAGFFGTITNLLEGNKTGQKATLASGLAENDQLAADRINNKRTQLALAGSDTGNADLSNLFDLTDNDNFTASVATVASTGADATHQMAAFNKALEQVGTSAAEGISGLDALDKYTLRQQTAANIQNDFLLNTASTNKEAASDPGDPSQADFGPKLLARAQAKSNLKVLKQVNVAALQTAAEQTTAAATESGKDPSDPTVLHQIAQAYYQSFLPVFKGNKSLADQAARQAAHQFASNAKTLTDASGKNVDAATLTAQGLTYAQNDAAQAQVNAQLGRTVLDPNNSKINLTKAYTVAGVSVTDNADDVAAKVKLSDLKTTLAALKKKPGVSKEDIQTAQANVDQATADAATAALSNLQANQALLDASIPPENVLAGIEQQIADIDAQLALPNIDEATKKADQAKKLQLQQTVGLQQITDTEDIKRGKTDSRDLVGNDAIDLDEAEKDLKDIEGRKAGTAAIARAQKKVNDAKIKQAQDENDLQVSQTETNLDLNDVQDAATAAVAEANAALADTIKGTAAYNKAIAQKRAALRQQAEGNDASAALSRQLSIDLTNPVQVANAAVETAQQALNTAISDGSGVNVVKQKRIDLENAQASAEAASFQNFITNVENANTLGTISHQQYMQYLENKRSQLQAELKDMNLTDNERKQVQDQVTQLSLSIKSAANDLSGQFNIGQIDIPTPYEVRKAVTAAAAGSVLKNNSAFSTAGNVTNDTSTRSVVLNGVPIQDVLSYIKDALGITVRSSTSTTTRKKP